MKATKNNNVLYEVLLEVQNIESRLEKLSVNIKDYWHTQSEITKLKEDLAKVYKTIAIEKIKDTKIA